MCRHDNVVKTIIHIQNFFITSCCLQQIHWPQSPRWNNNNTIYLNNNNEIRMAKTGKLVMEVLVRLIMSASTLSCNILNEIG